MSFIMVEYYCEECEIRFDSLETRGEVPPEMRHRECGNMAGFVISAPKKKTKYAEVSRGKSDPRPPHIMNTQAIADGVSTNDWRKQRSKARHDKRYAQIKANL